MERQAALLLLATLVIQTLIFCGAKAQPNITSCSQLPYPEACYHLRSSSQAAHHDLRRSIMLDALQEVRKTYAAAAGIHRRSMDARTHAAWADCMEHFRAISKRLRRSLHSGANEDSQTWLSAALTRFETCHDGFVDFGYASSFYSTPFASRRFHVNKVLCNCLAVNKNDYAPSPSRRLLAAGEDGFPDWVSSADRRLLQSPMPKTNANLVVAQDGSGNYRTISDAVAAAARTRKGTGRFIIYVKRGVYKENVQVPFSLTNLMIVGDGIDATVVTGSRNVVDGSTTFASATFATVGDGFIARDITFENTAGPQKQQAVALRSGADFSVFYRCSFKGYQDTLYTFSLRQFYRECDIYGTIDFIFGNAAVVLQNCNMYLRRPLPGQQNAVTAQGRTDPNQNTGISIHNSRITASTNLGSVRSYLGRPYKQYSRTVILKTFIDSSIAPAGWLEWDGNFALSTLFYGEYQNTGPGANTSGRVKWPGYRVITSADVAGQFTVGRFISGGSWLPATGVPYTLGL